MPILPFKLLVRFWVLSPEDCNDPADAVKKFNWDKGSFEDYFPNKLFLTFFNVSKTEFILNFRENWR